MSKINHHTKRKGEFLLYNYQLEKHSRKKRPEHWHPPILSIITVVDTTKTHPPPNSNRLFRRGGAPIEFGGVISLQESQNVSVQYLSFRTENFESSKIFRRGVPHLSLGGVLVVSTTVMIDFYHCLETHK